MIKNKLILGMTNPPYIMEHLEKVAKILNHPNVYAFLHLPVQSGSNQVLDKMNREYKVEDFNYVCGKIFHNLIKNKINRLSYQTSTWHYNCN